FGSSRIQELQQERINIQKKTFTKWMNSFLEQTPFKIGDLFEDLGDGKALHRLLEDITGNSLGRMNSGRLRVQKMENVSKVLSYIRTMVKLESIGAEDIVDGNPRLVLGLIWTIILRFQIQEVQLDDESAEQRSAKEALLLWCQRNTTGYPGVNVKNFTSSWSNGLAFNALIHHFRPDLIDFRSLPPEKHLDNLENAFRVAEKDLGIHPLLDPEDVDVVRPDEKSIMTYLIAYYQYFAKMRTEKTGGKRIGKIIGLIMEVEKMVKDYYMSIDDLLKWISKTIETLSERNFPNTIERIKKEMIKFNQYRTTEKPPKLSERSNLEVLFFNIQTKLRANNQKVFTPNEGKFISDINRAWEKLEKVEHGREIALRQEMQRLEHLENLAAKFGKKIGLHEDWLSDMDILLDESLQYNDKRSVEISIQRQEAIENDIQGREDRFMRLFSLADELVNGNYHGADDIRQKTEKLQTRWHDILAKLRPRQLIADALKELLVLYREIESATFELEDLDKRLSTKESNQSSLNVEALLERHNLIEKELETLRERIDKTSHKIQNYIRSGNPEYTKLRDKHTQLVRLYNTITDLCLRKRETLSEFLEFRSYRRSAEAELGWLKEKEQDFRTASLAKDLSNVPRMQKKQELLVSEMHARRPMFEKTMDDAEKASKLNNIDAEKLKDIISEARSKWQTLSRLSQERLKYLIDIGQLQQYLADCDDAESWINGKLPLVSNTDYGRDESNTETLLQNLSMVRNDVDNFDEDMQRLSNLCRSVIEMLEGLPSTPVQQQQQQQQQQMKQEHIPIQTLDDIDPEESSDGKEMLTEIEVPQVRALYPFEGKSMTMARDEVLLLMDKSHPDWWIVKNDEGRVGYAPANYIKEIAPRVLYHVSKDPKSSKKLRKEAKKELNSKPQQITAAVDLSLLPSINDIREKQRHLQGLYQQLRSLTGQRYDRLTFTHYYHGFKRDCDDIEDWINQQITTLSNPIYQSNLDHLSHLEKAFEQLERQLPSKQAQLKTIQDAGKDIIISKKYRQFDDEIVKSIDHVNQRWQVLLALKNQTGKNIQNLIGVRNVIQQCDELKLWLDQKQSDLTQDQDDPDQAYSPNETKKYHHQHLDLQKDIARGQRDMDHLSKLIQELAIEEPQLQQQVQSKWSELNSIWDQMQQQSTAKIGTLDYEFRLEQFMRQSSDLLEWAANMESNIDISHTMIDSVRQAEEFLEQNKENEATVVLHRENYTELIALGQSLKAEHPSHREQLNSRLEQLAASQDHLNTCWHDYCKYLSNCLDWQLLNRDYQQISKKYDAMEKLLTQYTDTSCPSNFDTIKRRYNEIEGPLKMQDDRLTSFNNIAQALLLRGHPQDEVITIYQRRIIERREQIWNLYDQLYDKLVVIEEIASYVKEVDEIIDWVSDKIHLLGQDDFYRDPSHTQSKLSKHENLEAEINANQDHVDDIVHYGQQLVKKYHDHGLEAKLSIDLLTEKWSELIQQTELRRRRLEQNSQLQSFNTNMKDIDDKITHIEHFSQYDVDGKDIVAIRHLYQKYKEYELQLGMINKTLQNINERCQEFVQDENYLAYKCMQKCQRLIQRYELLSQQIVQRKLRIEATALFHQFNQEIHDESTWIEDRLRNLPSLIVVTDIDGVIASQKRLNLLQLELTGHQEIIDQIIHGGDTLQNRSSMMKIKIQPLRNTLLTLLGKLKTTIQDKKKYLDIEYEVLQYLSKAEELEATMQDKLNLIHNLDHYQSEDTANRSLLLQQSIASDSDQYSKQIKALQKECQQIVQLDENKKDITTRKQSQLQDKLRQLKVSNVQLKSRLTSYLKCIYFIHQADELLAFIHNKMKLASSTDYGRNIDHVDDLWHGYEILRQEFDLKVKTYSDLKDLSDALIHEESPIQDQVKTARVSVMQSWTVLREEIKKRGENLESAATTHRLYMDLTDIQHQIDSKRAVLRQDVGRNLNAVLSLLRQHELFLNSVQALEDKVKVTVFKVDRMHFPHLSLLISKINQRAHDVQAQLKTLKLACDDYATRLNVSEQHYRCMNSVKDLASWAVSLNEVITSETTPQSRQELMVQVSSHEANGLEVRSKDSLIEEVLSQGQLLVNSQGRPAMDLYNALSLLRENSDLLKTNWSNRKQRLEQLHKYFLFEQSSQQIVHDLNDIQGKLKQQFQTLDELQQVDHRIKEVIQQLNQLNEIKDRIGRLSDSIQLMKDGRLSHKMTDNINHDIKPKYHDVYNHANDKLKEAKCQHAYLDFTQRVEEVRWRLVEKDECIHEICQYYLDTPSIEIRQNHLFQSLLLPCEKEKIEVIRHGQKLLDTGHPLNQEIHKQIGKLQDKWHQLKSSDKKLQHCLIQSKEMAIFNKDAQFELLWIEERLTIYKHPSLGHDLPQNQLIQRQLNEKEEEYRQNELYLKSIVAYGQKLIDHQHPSQDLIQVKRDQLNYQWSLLQQSIVQFKLLLKQAGQYFSFVIDANVIIQALDKMIEVLQNQDLGSAADTTQTYIATYRRLEGEITILQPRVIDFDQLATAMLTSCPPYQEQIHAKYDEVMIKWTQINQLSDQRKAGLDDQQLYHQFKFEEKYCSSYMDDIDRNMNAPELPQTLEDSENAIMIHNAQVNDLDKCADSLKKLDEMYQQNSHRPQAYEMKDTIQELFQRHDNLTHAWEMRDKLLDQNRNLHIFMQRADEIEQNFNRLDEHYLTDDMVEDSIDHVDLLQKELNEVDKNIEEYDQDRIALEKFALTLIQSGHYDKETILKRLNSLLTIKNRINSIYLSRRTELEQLQEVKEFFATCEELLLWINEKISIINDASFSVPTNLPLKLEKRQTVEKEVAERRDDVDILINHGSNLLWKSKHVGQSIAARLNEIDDRWHYLVDTIDKLRGLLISSFNGQQLLSQCEDMINWIKEVESELNSNQYGHDVSSTTELLDRHHQIENQLQNNHNQVVVLLDKIGQSLQTEHLLEDSLKNCQQVLAESFEPLEEIAEYRGAVLEEYLRIHRFIYSCDKEVLWMKEKEPLVNSTFYGKELNEVRKLLHKHEELQAQMNEHDVLIDAVIRFSSELTFHYCGDQYSLEGSDRSCQELMDRWSDFKYKSSKRRENLQTNVEIQVLIFSMNEIETTLGDMKAEVLSADLGVNEQMSQVLMQNLEILQQKLDNYHERLTNIESEINKFDEQELPELSTMKRKYASLAKLYTEVFDLARKRHDHLNRVLQAHQVSKEVDKLYNFLKEKELSPVLHDPCRDLDHVENIRQKLNEFYDVLEDCRNQVENFYESMQLLQRLNHPESHNRVLQDQLVKADDQLHHLYELAERRKQAWILTILSYHLHTYYHDVDEIIHWSQETEKNLNVDEKNAESVNLALLRNKHEQLKEDLANSVNLQVETVFSEKQYLMQTFPDEANHISDKHKQLSIIWSHLLENISTMDGKIEQIEHYQEFSREYKDICSWINRMMRYLSPDLSKSWTSLEDTGKGKRTLENDISEYHDRYIQWIEFGEALLDSGHFASNAIRDRMAHVNELWSNLQQEWLLHKKDLDQSVRDQVCNLGLLSLTSDLITIRQRT
ncbi:uncharacterized protein TRIADDRAFT_33212, partial [Trichoplax adhaerens]